MASMVSSETPIPELDRLSDTSTGVGVGKTREEYLRSFARPCASPQYTRPYSSPTSGFYDAMNTSTSLILLNKRFKNSHLREPTLIEEFSNVSETFVDKETIGETSRSIARQRSKSPRPSGQNKYWHNRRCASSCLNEHSNKTNEPRASRLSYRLPLRSASTQRNIPSARAKPESSLAEYQIDATFTKSYYPSSQEILEPFEHIDSNVQEPLIKEAPKLAKLKQNGTRQKLPLTENQQLYLLTKIRIYDSKETKIRRNQSYTQGLANRLKADIQCKPQFRLTDPQALTRYASVLQNSRRTATSSFSIRSTDYSHDLSKSESPLNISIQLGKSRILAPHQTLRQLRPALIQI